ncbi:hypothetical protein SAMN04487950_2397 [Halogranum rubrum]|uniref:DUF7260 domain-containing protein n=1 Tax=Halogranum rubrum TaxID=553466 RepID=A0A1I4EYD7_9EURY|nr:hypothetical protein [Halogranum rubrum]SFL09141.1 hypothetical protein SAMN04487950_2397 [Halogranum rubrum]
MTETPELLRLAQRLTRPVLDATTVVRRERRRSVDERESFETFGRRVRRLTPDASDPSLEPLSGRLLPGVSGVRSGPTLAAVRTSYTETVMAVPHYREEYDDTLEESLTVEFGREVAEAVVAGDTLSTELQDALLTAAALARTERDQFVERIDAEDASLAAVVDGVRRLVVDLGTLDDTPLPDRSFDELRALDREVASLERQCDRLVTDRQASIRSAAPASTDPSLQAYLYQHESTRYPVLTCLADLGEVLTQARRRVQRQLTVTA